MLNHFKKTGSPAAAAFNAVSKWRTKTARVATALTLAATLTAQAAEPGTNTDPNTDTEASRLIDAFGMDFNRAASCPQRPVAALPLMTGMTLTGTPQQVRDLRTPQPPKTLIAHVEPVGTLFFDTKDPYTKHGATAAQILWDRVNAGQDGCQPVYLLDLNQNYDQTAVTAMFTHFSVVTVSSFSFWTKNGSNAETKPYHSDDPTVREQVLRDSLALDAKRSPFTKVASITPSFWDTKSDSVIVVSATNGGADLAKNKAVLFTPLYESGGLIVTGALDGSGAVAPYSAALAPDVAGYTAFAQGYCFPFAATADEIDLMGRTYNTAISFPPPHNAGVRLCDMTGTSFTSPDIGGYAARARLEFPRLGKEEVAVAAFLATTTGIKNTSGFKSNARGNDFNVDTAGHGGFLPPLFHRLASDLDRYKADGHESLIGRTSISASFPATAGVGIGGKPVTARHRINRPGMIHGEQNVLRLSLNTGHDDTIIRTIGHLVFSRKADADAADIPAHFPSRILITSPSGTLYGMPLRLDNARTTKTDIAAGFSSSAWLGENSQGEWKVQAPAGYVLKSASIDTIAAAATAGNTVDWLIDHAQDLKRQAPAMEVAIDDGPWRSKPLLQDAANNAGPITAAKKPVQVSASSSSSAAPPAP